MDAKNEEGKVLEKNKPHIKKQWSCLKSYREKDSTSSISKLN